VSAEQKNSRKPLREGAGTPPHRSRPLVTNNILRLNFQMIFL